MTDLTGSPRFCDQVDAIFDEYCLERIVAEGGDSNALDVSPYDHEPVMPLSSVPVAAARLSIPLSYRTVIDWAVNDKCKHGGHEADDDDKHSEAFLFTKTQFSRMICGHMRRRLTAEKLVSECSLLMDANFKGYISVSQLHRLLAATKDADHCAQVSLTYDESDEAVVDDDAISAVDLTALTDRVDPNGTGYFAVDVFVNEMFPNEPPEAIDALLQKYDARRSSDQPEPCSPLTKSQESTRKQALTDESKGAANTAPESKGPPGSVRKRLSTGSIKGRRSAEKPQELARSQREAQLEEQAKLEGEQQRARDEELARLESERILSEKRKNEEIEAAKLRDEAERADAIRRQQAEQQKIDEALRQKAAEDKRIADEKAIAQSTAKGPDAGKAKTPPPAAAPPPAKAAVKRSCC